MLIVEAEDVPDNKAAEEENDGPGGFLKEDLLLSSRVEKDDIYSRQQGGASTSFTLYTRCRSCNQSRAMWC